MLYLLTKKQASLLIKEIFFSLHENNFLKVLLLIPLLRLVLVCLILPHISRDCDLKEFHPPTYLLGLMKFSTGLVLQVMRNRAPGRKWKEEMETLPLQT